MWQPCFSVSLKKLNLPFVTPGLFQSLKCAQVAAFSGFEIPFARIKPITAVLKFSNHKKPPSFSLSPNHANGAMVKS
jgi:hypothetical protein